MSKRARVSLLLDREVHRFKVFSVAMSIALDDSEEDYFFLGGQRRKRTHAFWMSPYLLARTDTTQRNTFAKLETDFIRVCIA